MQSLEFRKTAPKERLVPNPVWRRRPRRREHSICEPFRGLLKRRGVASTIDTHGMQKPGLGVRSPLDS